MRHEGSCAASVSTSVPAASTASPARRPYSALNRTPSARLPAAITVTVPPAAAASGSAYQGVVTSPSVRSADAPSRATRLPHTCCAAAPCGRLPA